MTTYLIDGFARTVGALGLADHVVLEVEATSPRAAKLKAYETHEHFVRPTTIQAVAPTAERGERMNFFEA